MKGGKTVNDYTAELMLAEFYALEGALGGTDFDRASAFRTLADIFIVGQKEANTLFALSACEEVADIASPSDYRRYCRIVQYMGSSRAPEQPGIEYCIAAKGTVFCELEEYGIACNTAVRLHGDALNRLRSASAAGVVRASRLLGLMYAAGITVPKDLPRGIKLLDRCARWNDIAALYMLAYFDDGGRAGTVGVLSALLKYNAEYAAAAALAERYGEAGEVCADGHFLLERVFDGASLRRDRYVPAAARVVYSGILDTRSKERLLFSGGESALSAAAELPLKLRVRGDMKCNAEAFASLPLKRTEQVGQIVKAFANADLRLKNSYRPLCICADSRYVLEMFAAACARSLPGQHAEIIDVGATSFGDFEPRAGNIFVRSCNEDRSNVYMMFFTGSIEDAKADAAASFLRTSARKAFCLCSPDLVLDLRAIMPVCFCDRTNSARLAKMCNVVDIGQVGSEEKRGLLDYILENKRREYGLAAVKAEVKAVAGLLAMSADEMESAADRIIAAKRTVGQTVPVLERDLLKAAPSAGNKFGFGGLMYENDERIV